MNTTARLPWAPGDVGISFRSTNLVRQCVLQLKGRTRCAALKQMCGQHNTAMFETSDDNVAEQKWGNLIELGWALQPANTQRWTSSKWESNEGGHHLPWKSWSSLSQEEAYNQSVTSQNSDVMGTNVVSRHLQSPLLLQGSAAVLLWQQRVSSWITMFFPPRAIRPLWWWSQVHC